MYLGVDGGGTKTAYALVDEHGRIRATHQGGSISHLASGLAAATGMLLEGIRTTLAGGGLAAAQVTFAYFGLPAYGEDSSITAQMDAMPSALIDTARYRCGNDMICSWAGSLAGAEGISVIAGTGSMAYGEYSGRTARAGGWGELIGDEGSAYWIAREGLNLFSRMSDGRAPPGPLLELVRRQLGIAVDLDLCARIYGPGANARDAFAQFARLVHAAVEAGDEQARAIYLRAADELVATVVATRRALKVPENQVLPVSWSGGAFSGSALLVSAFRAAIAASRGRFECRPPEFPPVIGGALHAARLAGRPLSGDALATLRTGCATAGLPR